MVLPYRIVVRTILASLLIHRLLFKLLLIVVNYFFLNDRLLLRSVVQLKVEQFDTGIRFELDHVKRGNKLN